MTWSLVLTNPAGRDLRTLPRADLEHVNAAFKDMCADPYGGDVKFLKGTDRTLRRRVGDWRILYEVRAPQRLVVILSVTRRSSNTY